MTMKTAFRHAAAVSMLLLGSVAGPLAVAQDSNRKELRREDLSGAPGMEVILSVTELKPGDGVPEHFHHGIETGYVLEGGTLESTTGAKLRLETGSPIMNLRDAKHGGFKVTGTKTIKLLTVHIVDKGKPLYDDSKN